MPASAKDVQRALWFVLGAAMLAVFALYAFSRLNAPPPNVGEPDRLEALGYAPDFDFRTPSGGTVSSQSLRGHVWVADFFFMSCTGVCPALTANMKRVQEAFADEPGPKLVSFTVDPERDTLERLSEYAKKQGAIRGKWFFARGSQKQVFELARNGFKLGSTEVPGDILHSNRFVLVDREGRIRGYYDGTEEEAVNRVIVDARTLLGQGG